jgi:NtrC-family two-component system sensor histidine kinase KinB
MTSLPTLRRRILQGFLWVVVLYAFLGSLLVLSVFISSGTTPKLLHLNYDSISAATQMREAWNGLGSPDKYPARTSDAWTDEFEKALKFEEGNITEPGEKQIAQSIRAQWDLSKGHVPKLDSASFQAMGDFLNQLVQVNEKGMFGLAAQNKTLSDQVLIGSILYFLISLAIVIVFSQQFALRLSQPLKDMAEILHSRPTLKHRLKLPEPTTLELLVLSMELKRLWERLVETEKVNVAALVKEKGKLETVLESVEDALLFVDAEGVVGHCNDCLVRLVGLPQNEIQNRPWEDLPSMNDNYMRLRGSLRQVMVDGLEIDLVLQQQKFSYSARARKIAGGTLYLLHDITEKKQRDKFRSEFVDLLSHELKTPLQSLGTATELLSDRKEEFPGDLKIMVETIAEDVERIRAVAQEFVQVTQSHSKILKLKLERVPLNHVLKEWIKPFSILARDRKVKIEMSQEGSETIWANLDLVKFPWVVSNLLSNAIRHSPAGAEVSIALTDRNGAVEIQIKDQGAGIPESDRPHIFEAFFQGTLATGGRGMFGVGLTIAKEVVEAHDGRIEYFPRIPAGSEFRITLPFPPLYYPEGGAS